MNLFSRQGGEAELILETNPWFVHLEVGVARISAVEVLSKCQAISSLLPKCQAIS